MSSESLSQNDIDLLFSGGGSETPEAPTSSGPDVQVYDFRKPARISKDRNRSLLGMYGMLAKAIDSWITGRVREQLVFELQSVEQLTFGELVLALPSPCASYIVDVPGTGRQGVIDFGHEFAFYIVDRLLGGVGLHQVPARSLTELERLVVQIAAERVSSLLSDAWKDYVPLNLEVSGFESIPEMLRVANREDAVLVANILVSTENMSSLLVLALPFNTVEKFFTGTSSRRPEAPQGTPEERLLDRSTIEGTVRNSRLPIGVRLPDFSIPMSDLASLQPGELLHTGLDLDTELDLLVAGQRRFVGAAGRVGQSLAIRVTDRVYPEPDDTIEAGRADLRPR